MYMSQVQAGCFCTFFYVAILMTILRMRTYYLLDKLKLRGQVTCSRPSDLFKATELINIEMREEFRYLA